MNIVLVEPEIPYNTGNIGRTCLLTNTKLFLIKPLGFSLDDKNLKRAGLDYWKDVDCEIFDTLENLMLKFSDQNFYFATTKTDQKYSDIKYKNNDFLVFGKESKGIDKNILSKYKNSCITIPMIKIGRSLNLSNSVAIILYEALRQLGFGEL